MIDAAGFEELEHTADWALRVWAPDLNGLFEQAARGMYALMEVPLETGVRVQRSIDLAGSDLESGLVGFLSELLFLAEDEGLAFDTFDLQVRPERITAALEGAPFLQQRKEIKAVTYHRLAIITTPNGYEVTIVFDV